MSCYNTVIIFSSSISDNIYQQPTKDTEPKSANNITIVQSSNSASTEIYDEVNSPVKKTKRRIRRVIMHDNMEISSNNAQKRNRETDDQNSVSNANKKQVVLGNILEFP